MITDTPLRAGPDSTTLFAKLRSVLAEYGVRAFGLYAVEGHEARLVFSAGSEAAPVGLCTDRLDTASFPGLDEFLTGDGPQVLERAMARDPGLDLFSHLPGVTALVRLSVEGRPVGLVLVYDEGDRGGLRPIPVDELASLVALFSTAFAQRRTVDGLRRDCARIGSQLQELRDALRLLLLHDRDQVMHDLLARALSLLNARTGALLLRDGLRSELACKIEGPDSAQMDEMATLVSHCYETGRPCAVSSLSGEWIEQFDVDSIHIASTAAFPLRAGTDAPLGCVVAFDAAISLDVVEILESSLLAGATAIQNWHNSQRMLDEQRLREQMRLAAEAQLRLLPASAIKVRNLSAAHFSLYCDEAGGDYVDAVVSTPELCTFAVGDVSGHGLSAAMRMVDVRARLRAYLTAGGWVGLENLMSRLNADLCGECGAAEFVTLFLCAVDTRTGRLEYASAGHEFPLLHRARSGEWELLRSTGLPLGMAQEASYTANSLRLEQGDILVIATDGATEARDLEGAAFGTSQIRDAVEQSAHFDASRVLTEIVQVTLAHRQGEPFADDVTYLVLKLEGVALHVAEALPEPPGDIVYESRFPCTRADKDTCLQELHDKLLTGVAEAERSALLTAAEEVLTNAIVHGNREDRSQAISVRLHLAPAAAALVVRHQGVPFDPFASYPARMDERALMRENGRGLVIIASLVDEVVYADSGRSVLLRKQLAGT